MNLSELVQKVDRKRLEATVRHLASYPTRNTLAAGHKQAAEWLVEQYRTIPGLKVELVEYVLPKGRRVPEDRPAFQVLATLPGDSDRCILVGGHLDSLNLQVKPDEGPAPGANDDASGVSVALECARILAGHRFPLTIHFVAWTGEEQGLNGSGAMAALAKEKGWKLEALLSNDTVGSSGNKAGQRDRRRVRVFSAEPGEAKVASRELARYIEWCTRGVVKSFGPKLVFRQDRFGRGGDHTPFHRTGFPAVRLVEVHEEYTRQHTPDDLPEHMDFGYLANVCRLNLASLFTLAHAGAAPTNVRVKLDQFHDTTLTWAGDSSTDYVVYWRETTSPTWQGSFEAGHAHEFVIKGINKDDHIFAVGARSGIPVEAS